MNNALKHMVSALNDKARVLNIGEFGNGKSYIQLNSAEYVDELSNAPVAEKLNGLHHGPLYVSHCVEIAGVEIFGVVCRSDDTAGLSKAQVISIISVLDKCGAYPSCAAICDGCDGYDGIVILTAKLRDIARNFGVKMASKISAVEENGVKCECLYYYAVIDGVRFEEAA